MSCSEIVWRCICGQIVSDEQIVSHRHSDGKQFYFVPLNLSEEDDEFVEELMRK